MPGMGGLDAIPRMLELAAPARILVVSSLTVRGAEHTLAALSLGAADTLAKPQPGKFDKEYRATLLRKIRLLGRVAKRARVKSAPRRRSRCGRAAKVAPQLLAIGASTGGIHALGQLLGSLTAASARCRSWSPSTCRARSWTRSCASCARPPGAARWSRTRAWRCCPGRSSSRPATRT